MSLSVWTVKPAVLTRLATLAPDSADIVQAGLPTQLPSNAEPRRVYMLDVPLDEPLPIYVPSNQVRKETYVIPIAVEVVSFTGNALTGYADTSAAVGALVGAIEDLCAADPSWGGVCNVSGLGLAAESTGPLADQAGGWVGKALIELHILKYGG